MSNSETSGRLSATSFLTSSVSHPRLLRTDSESVRVFLRLYDQYVREIASRSKQLTVSGSISTEPIRPVNIKYCVDPEIIESALALGFIEGHSNYDKLPESKLRAYLEKKAEESKEAVNLDTLDSIVRTELKMDMSDSNATSRMESLFMAYHKLLRINGLAWVLKSNQKISVFHVLSAIKPLSLQNRIESDLEFAYYDCRKDFQKFMRHCIRLSESFQVLDNGPTKKREENRNTKPKRGGNNNDKPPRTDFGNNNYKKGGSSTRQAPPCPHPPCKAKGSRHWIRDCTDSSDKEKTNYISEIAASKSRDGPSRSTRSQTGDRKFDPTDTVKGRYTVGRMKKPHSNNKNTVETETPSCPVLVSDGMASISATGRCDDGSDDSLASPTLAERAAIQGIGKIRKVNPVHIQVALKSGDDAQSFTFSRTWTIPRTVLQLASGQLALANVSFLVADDELACEELIIGLPVLRHLQVDTRTLLENNRSVLDGSDCSHVGNPTTRSRGGIVSRMMFARMNRVVPEHTANEIAGQRKEDRPRVNFYTARTEEDPFPDPSLLDPIDSDQHGEIIAEIGNLKKIARDNGLPNQDANRLDKIIDENRDVFRTSFSSGPHAKLRPLRIDLTRDARPVKVRLRNYSKEQQDFLTDMTDKLVEHGMAYPNPTSAWACAPLLVPKDGPTKFRFTVDLRPVNRFTVKHQFPMPNIEHELGKLSGSRYFATFDLSHGYWQLELDPESRHLQSFITPHGIFSPTRVLHGTTNAVAHLQSALAEVIPTNLRKKLLVWLDDILLHDKTVSGILDSVQEMLHFCGKFNLKLHPGKCILFAKKIRWCGRLISENGIRYDPRRLDGLLNMELPTTGAHLQQFICALQWVKSGVPKFTDLIAPLHNFMEKVYGTSGKRTRLSVSRYKLSTLGWGESETTAFGNCKTALAKQVTLSHRDTDKRLCVYTDASDSVWSGIVTQVPYEDLKLNHADQRHEPLAFLSGRFNSVQSGWAILEKEAYAILATLARMHWTVATPDGFDLFTDHNNLIFLFDPLSVMPDMTQTTLRKVLRWAVRLSVYSYTCFHIKGPDNVWADLLGRWSAPPLLRRLIRIPELPSSSATDFDWPTSTEVADEQSKAEDEQPPDLELSDGLWRNPSGSVWIPDRCSDLQIRLCIIAHTGPAGHRGRDATERVMRKYYFWSTMTTDIRTFVQACIHCLSTIGGGKVPRPFGPAVHGTSPNDLLQFDYIELGPTPDGTKYVLMLRDDHSDYHWFFAFPDTSAENAAVAIIDWCAALGVPNGFMSDGPTHFRNETVRLISKGLKVPHHFTLPYSPWSNGAVERLGRELLRVMRSVLSELQMPFTEWPDILPLVQSALNNSPSPQRGNISPFTAFMGREPTAPIATFLRNSTTKSVTVDATKLESLMNITQLKNRVAELHPIVENTLEKNRSIGRKNASRGKLPNFTEGDFVLVAREDFFAGEKLALRWRGPRRVQRAINDYVYLIEDLRTGESEELHASRLKFYHDPTLNTDVIMSHVIQSETGMTVQRLMGLEEHSDGLYVVVRWKGLPDSDDTLEPIAKVHEDVPAMLERLFQRKNTPRDLVEKARNILAL